MTAWTRNAVSVAEPSVWNQFVSRGTLRNRKYLIAADEAGALLQPVERIHGGRLDLLASRRLRPRARPSAARRPGARSDRARPRGRRRARPGPVCAVLLDHRVCALPSTLATLYGLEQDQPAVLDRVLVAVERAHRRARGAVALGVVGPAVAGAAEVRREHRCEPHLLDRSRSGTSFAASSSIGPLGWTGQPRWTQRFERIVKLGQPSESPL